MSKGAVLIRGQSLREMCVRVSSGPYFPVFSPNTEKCGSEKTPYLDTFHAVIVYLKPGLCLRK